MAGLFNSLNMSAQQKDITANQEKDVLDLGRHVEYNVNEGTGAVSTISSDELSHKNSIHMTNQLFGMIPGLQVLQNTGAAWEDNASFYVRGIGTLGNKGPLVLIDGFERALSELATEEIESVSVLKDAVATSIYGMRGANGVILVKTKRGSVSAPQINVSYTFNMATPNRLPEFADAYNYANALNQALSNDGLPQRYSDKELDAFKNQTHPGFYPNVDWVDESLRNMTFGDDITFSAKGGSKNVKYFTMLDFQDNRGLLNPTSDNDGYSTQQKYSKLNIRTNLDIAVSKTTSVQLNFLGKFDEHNRPGSTTEEIFEALYNVPSGAFPIKTENGVWGGNENYANNPVAMISGKGYARSQNRALYADFHLNQRLDAILPGLNAGVKVGIDNTASYWDSNKKDFGYESASINLDTQEKRFKTMRNDGNLSFSKSVGKALTHFNFEAYTNYAHTWNKHALDATVTYSMDKTNAKGQNKSRAFIDVMAQAHYAYNNRYLVDFSLGSTGSSILDPDDNWGIFPAAGLGWIISNEDFFNASNINFLKVRTSYGISGRAEYDVNLYKDIYGGGNSFLFGANNSSLSGQKLTHLGMSNLTYEKSHKFNFGVDMKAWNKLSVNVDAFYEHRNDILIDTKGTISSALGVQPTKKNLGVVNNYGVEAIVAWDHSINDVKYHVGGNFSFVRNEIDNMNEEYRPYDYLKRTGHSVNQIFGYEVEGIYKSQQDIDNREVKQYLGPVRPGDLMFKDQNGDNRIDSYDQVALGYNTLCPEIYYAFDLGVEYKGLGLYAQFQGAGNYSAILNTKSIYRPIVSNNTISNYYLENCWSPSNLNGTLPRLTYEGSDNNYNNNSLWVADASFLKLRTLELYYNIPTKAMMKIVPLNKLKVFARAHDLFCIDKIDLQDPEAIGAVHPAMTQYSFGVNLIF